jgi:hypothetical protein
MKAKDVIKFMKQYHPDDNLLVMWWDINAVAGSTDFDDQVVTNEEWNQLIDEISEYDWDGINSDVYNVINEELDNIRKEK